MALPKAQSSGAAKGPAAPPAGAAYLRTQALGLLLVGMGGAIYALGAAAAGIAAMMFGAFFAAFGFAWWLRAPGARALNTSLNLLSQGRLAEAEKILDGAEKRFLGANRSALFQQRAIIALRRGDLPAALAQADAAVRLPLGLFRTVAILQRTNAHGIRAFVRASLGDAEGARADAGAVAARPDAFLPARGRTALAEAMLLERAGDRAALREHLARSRETLLEGTAPRERAIVRAYQRMVKVSATTPYRQSARRDEAAAAEEPALVDWVAKIAPGAAAFVRAPAAAGGGEPVPAAATTDEGRRAVAEARRKLPAGVQSRRRRAVAISLGALFGLGGAVFAALSALGPGAPEVPGGDAMEVAWVLDAASLVIVSMVVAGAVVVGATIAQAWRHGRRLLQAAPRLITDPAGVEAELVALTGSRHAMIRAQAHLYLGALADRRGDVAGLLDQCEIGLAEVSGRSVKALAGDVVTPALASQRAFGLAARDRFDEAQAEIDALPAAFPLLALARFRVRLLSLVRQGALEAALRFVERETADLPLSPRDELLADAVRVAVAPHTCGAAEVLRVKEDLLRAADLRRWMQAFAPSLVEAVERAPREEDDDDAQAHEEAALAEAEAAMDAPRAVALRGA